MKALTLITATLLFCSIAGETASAQASNPDSLYAAMVEQVKSGDTTVDFQQLRYTYAKTSLYRPTAGPYDPQAMYDFFQKEDYKHALEEAQKILGQNYVNIEAHFVCSIAYQMLGDSARWQLHDAVLMGLLRSILSSGDGMSQETAFKVIAVAEEHSLLSFIGYKFKRQELIIEGNPPCDLITVVDEETNAESKLYFDISLPLTAMNKMLGDPKEVR